MQCREQGFIIDQLITLTDWLHGSVGSLRESVGKLSEGSTERERAVENEFDRMHARSNRHRDEINGLSAVVADLQDLARDVQGALSNVQGRLCNCGHSKGRAPDDQNAPLGLLTPPRDDRDVAMAFAEDRDREEVRRDR